MNKLTIYDDADNLHLLIMANGSQKENRALYREGNVLQLALT